MCLIRVKRTAELDKKFNELMNRSDDEREMIKLLSNDEMKFLGEYCIEKFYKKFPSICNYYVDNFDAETSYYGDRTSLERFYKNK